VTRTVRPGSPQSGYVGHVTPATVAEAQSPSRRASAAESAGAGCGGRLGPRQRLPAGTARAGGGPLTWRHRRPGD
jgi:hypothetical protein